MKRIFPSKVGHFERINDDLSVVHGEDADRKNEVHPFVGPFACLELNSGEPLSLILADLGRMRRFLEG